jgi:CBS domain containing-hemolysin-like protein
VSQALEPGVERVVGEGAAKGVSVVLGLILATVVQLVAAELIPKNVAVARPERTALRLAVPMRAYASVFAPLINLLNGSANAIVRLFGVEPVQELESIRSLDELEFVIRSSGEEGTIPEEATRLLTRSIRFVDKTAADALVPRGDIMALPESATIAALAAFALEHGYSRYPVYREGLDDIVGVALAKDVFRVAPADRATTTVTAVAETVLAVPESRRLDDLLVVMRQSGHQLAVVIDEYGGTSGIVTLEDVLEEIVGAIEDEYDEPELTPPPPAGAYELDAALHPDEVEDLIGLRLPEGEYETLAGFLLVRFDRIPDPGDSIEWDGWRFDVATLDRHRITRVVVHPPAPAGPAEEAGGP